MHEYFKNKDEKKALEEIITSSTEINTEKTVNHFHDMAIRITSIIDEIEGHFGAEKEDKDLPGYPLIDLKTDLVKSMDDIFNQLKEYDNEHPLFHDNLKDWSNIQKEINIYINKLENEDLINTSDGNKWEEKKEKLFNELTTLEESIKNNTEEIDEKDIIESN